MSNGTQDKIGRIACIVAGVVAAAPSAAVDQEAAARPAVTINTGPAVLGTTTAQPDAQGQQLATTIQGEIAALPADAPAEDVEAAIVYAISQSGVSGDAVLIALQNISVQANVTPGLQGAIGRVQTALLTRKSLRGTAAITGGGFNFTGSGFLSPSLVLGGGGSTTYSS